MNIRHQNQVFTIFLLWIFASAFYYAGDFLTGNLGEGRSINYTQQVFKYIIAIILSIVFMYINRSKLMGLVPIYFISLLFFLMALLMTVSGYGGRSMLDTLVVFIAFVGFSFAASSFNRQKVKKLSLVIIISACIVSLVSFYEFFFMKEILGNYWKNTGGYRSISTLLNPNNLGIYLGAALVINFTVLNSGILQKAIVATPLFAALLMSGSRTAIFSFFTSMLMVVIFRGGGGYRVWNIVGYLVLVLLSLVAVSVILLMSIVNLPERASNMHTATLRIEKYLEFLLSCDVTYFWPDYFGVRAELVSESAYFHFANSFGLVYGFLFISLLYFFNFSFVKAVNYQRTNFAFGILVFYYLFVGLFANVIMSFPNNQLLFIAAGLAWSRKLNSNL